MKYARGRVSESGRLSLPAEFRKAVGLARGGNVVITIGYTENQLRSIFGEVTLAARISPPYAIPEESNLPIYICRKPKAPLPQMWPRLRWLG